MTYTLSPDQKATIKGYVDAFWGDFKFKIEGQKVIFYVDAWQGHMYFLDFGEFDNPHAVIQAIEDCPIYQNRSRYSAKYGQAVALLDMQKEMTQNGLIKHLSHMHDEFARADFLVNNRE